jgi:hypothetical protein
VKARGRVDGFEELSSFLGRVTTLQKGTGDMSIGSQSKPSESRGGEFKETVEAKESSRSEERKSSTSSWGRAGA